MAQPKRILCAFLPHWPIARRCRRGRLRFDWRTDRVVVVRDVHQMRRVVDASPATMRHGIRLGMSLAEARALCPSLAQLEHEPAEDARKLEALGRWMTRFTPEVSTSWEADQDEELPHVLLLDITGCDRLFGGLDQLLAQVRDALARFRIPAQLAIAPTVGAAWAIALCDGHAARIVDTPVLDHALSPLPPSSLRLDPETLASLHHLGLRTIKQLRALPRNQLLSRFGPKLLLRLDQFTGERPELLTPLAWQPPVTTAIEFDFPIDALETLWTIFEELLDRLLPTLTRRGLGARTLSLTCTPDRATYRPPLTKGISLTRPTRDRKTLLNLLRDTIERLPCDDGFTSFRLSVPEHERITGTEQSTAFGERDEIGDLEMDQLVDRLRLRLGPSAVLRPSLVESYLPERAWRDDAPAGATLLTETIRPLCLLPVPTEIRVICQPSDDRTGSPRQFTHLNQVHPLTHTIGPERITGEWWRGHQKVRDYYDVEDDTGRRYWIFRVNTQTSTRWFLHGQFQ